MELTVPARYRGPSASGNGGWVAGALAAHVPTSAARPSVSVRLSAPPPLGRPLALVGDDPDPLTGTSVLRLLDGDTLVATGSAVPELDEPVPEPSGVEEARAAEARFRGLGAHPAPECFGCGPDRDDGLRLRPGPLDDGTGRYATTWVAPADVAVPTVWAALDCPGGWATEPGDAVVLLGTITARVWRCPDPGETTVVTAWQRGVEGRRRRSATTLHATDGTLLGRAESTWVAVDPTHPATS